MVVIIDTIGDLKALSHELADLVYLFVWPDNRVCGCAAAHAMAHRVGLKNPDAPCTSCYIRARLERAGHELGPKVFE